MTASNAAHARAAQDHAALLSEQEAGLFRSVFETPSGEQVLNVIMVRLCGLAAKHGGHLTPEQTLYVAGRRDVGLDILDILGRPSTQTIRDIKRKR